jgi:WD40 repeat protein
MAEAQRKRLADAQVEQSKVITQLANKEIDRGDAVKGIFLALAALPKLDDLDKPDRPIVKEAVSALERGLIACRELADLQGHQKAIYSAAWNQDGTRLATASDDGTARVWDIASRKQIRQLVGHEGPVYSVAWAARDGTRLATASSDGTARVWDMADGKVLPLVGHAARVNAVAWSPDGRWLATASDDGTARVWDAANGTEMQKFDDHKNWVLAVAWSPDGTRLATASDDGTARVWDTESRREILQNTELADLAKEVESRLPKGLTIEQKEQRSTVAWQLSTLAFRVAD